MTRQTDHIANNVALIRQGIAATTAAGPAAYYDESNADAVSPMGTHFRHVLDHYRAFLDGLPTGMVNYDARQRDLRVERDIGVATRTAEDIIARLEHIQDATLSRTIQVSANIIEDGQSTVDWSPSAVKRELMYLVSHTVHHYAIIRLLATHAGVDLAADFGVAPSTIAHRRLHEACAPSAG